MAKKKKTPPRRPSQRGAHSGVSKIINKARGSNTQVSDTDMDIIRKKKLR